ncbi:hypothetical protein FACS1894184_16470 [Clostridia bacterium]|nr:hypothetical protein FACS1894184_16470 [Clostridia bacterium]
MEREGGVNTSRRHNKPKLQPKPQINNTSVATTDAANTMAFNAMKLATDAYSNYFARLGGGQDNITSAGAYKMTRRTQDFGLMNTLYRTNWIARRIIDAVAEDMCKNWYKLTSVSKPDALAAYAKAERRARVKESLITGLKWGRLFGGAAGLIMISRQEDALEEPIDYRMIMPGDFKGVATFDRWNGVFPSSELVSDMDDPDFGLPDYYTFYMGDIGSGKSARVHHSRVLRFTGRELPYIEKQTEVYWGMSELEHVYDELSKRDMTSANLTQLIFQANLRVLKMQDLGEMLTTSSKKIQEDLYKTVSAQNMLMNSHGIQLLNKDDEFQTFQYTFSGLSEVYQEFMMDIAGAAEMPVTKLFGRSPAGMNATGDADMRNYYDMIKQKQESLLRPVLDKLIPIICVSAWGEVPNDIDYDFESIRESSQDEISSIVQRTTQAVLSAVKEGVISPKTALLELRNTNSTTGLWGSITDEDIENADDMTPLAPYETNMLGGQTNSGTTSGGMTTLPTLA